MKKALQILAIPFIRTTQYLLAFLIYLVFVLVRIMKAPFPNAVCDQYKFWVSETEHDTIQRSRDIFLLFLTLVPVFTVLLFGWFWLLLVACIYLLTFIFVTAYYIPKRTKRNK